MSLEKSDFDVVLLDMNFSAGINTGNEGLYWLTEIKKICPTTEIVMITAYGDVELAVKALKNGAADFILKPWENEKLIATLKATLKLRRSGLQVEELKRREATIKLELNQEPGQIIGNSPCITSMLHTIAKVSVTDANVLITGENGTGKELVAHAIHRGSDRKNELLVSIDMGAIPETLFESELFGHKRGSFTDAREDRIGKFQLANKGTLFLDEIGNLPLQLQAKLLNALQSRTIIPLGSNQPEEVDIRLICATNCNPDELVEQRKFREDLLYRINTICIEVPPLRERKGDIELLTNFFLEKYSHKYRKPGLKISSSAIMKLNEYYWPGNVRELQHTIEKAVILSDSGTLQPGDFIFKTSSKHADAGLATFEEMEKQMIESALEKNNGQHSAVARQLGISRQTLYNKIKRYGI
jgi:DNA-binding NtrC family response regulator